MIATMIPQAAAAEAVSVCVERRSALFVVVDGRVVVLMLLLLRLSSSSLTAYTVHGAKKLTSKEDFRESE